MRCFFGINLPGEIKEKAALIQSELKRTGPDVKWVNPRQLHLTLYFFKNLPPEETEVIIKKVHQAVLNFGTFDIFFKGVGSFPPSRDPRVIWIGMEKSPELAAMVQTLKKVCRPFDTQSLDRDAGEGFVPHLTVGRVRSRKNIRGLIEKMKDFTDYPLGNCRVSELTFFESRLMPEGPIYSELGRFYL